MLQPDGPFLKIKSCCCCLSSSVLPTFVSASYACTTHRGQKGASDLPGTGVTDMGTGSARVASVLDC